jgi:hypothetical protein
VRALALVLSVGCLASVAAQHPTSMTLSEAASKARAVVAAKVVDVRVEDRGWIQTVVDFETFATGKGESPGRFTYRMMGGRLGATQTMSGEALPSFTPGEEVVLFLAPQIASDGNPTLYRGHIYRISRSPSGARLVMALPAGLPLGAPQAARPGETGPVPLEQFLSFVQSIR